MGTTPTDFATAAQALAAALYAATFDPADAIRLLGQLADFAPEVSTSSSTVGRAIASMQTATGDLFRRAAVVAMARAASTYQPASFDDAVAVRGIVCDALDTEITIAGDQGEDGVYSALRTLRRAVVQDLEARGASLARMKTFSAKANLPSLVLANKLYGDSTREGELVTQANPCHPAFMPTSFTGLAE